MFDWLDRLRESGGQDAELILELTRQGHHAGHVLDRLWQWISGDAGHQTDAFGVCKSDMSAVRGLLKRCGWRPVDSDVLLESLTARGVAQCQHCLDRLLPVGWHARMPLAQLPVITTDKSGKGLASALRSCVALCTDNVVKDRFRARLPELSATWDGPEPDAVRRGITDWAIHLTQPVKAEPGMPTTLCTDWLERVLAMRQILGPTCSVLFPVHIDVKSPAAPEPESHLFIARSTILADRPAWLPLPEVGHKLYLAPWSIHQVVPEDWARLGETLQAVMDVELGLMLELSPVTDLDSRPRRLPIDGVSLGLAVWLATWAARRGRSLKRIVTSAAIDKIGRIGKVEVDRRKVAAVVRHVQKWGQSWRFLLARQNFVDLQSEAPHSGLILTPLPDTLQELEKEEAAFLSDGFDDYRQAVAQRKEWAAIPVEQTDGAGVWMPVDFEQLDRLVDCVLGMSPPGMHEHSGTDADNLDRSLSHEANALQAFCGGDDVVVPIPFGNSPRVAAQYLLYRILERMRSWEETDSIRFFRMAEFPTPVLLSLARPYTESFEPSRQLGVEFSRAFENPPNERETAELLTQAWGRSGGMMPILFSHSSNDLKYGESSESGNRDLGRPESERERLERVRDFLRSRQTLEGRFEQVPVIFIASDWHHAELVREIWSHTAG